MVLKHPWHDISVGDKAPEIVTAIIEIPKDSKIKFEMDKDTGLLKLDRFLYSAVHYPGDYGFLPQTLWEDGDPLDILIFTARPSYPLTLANARIIGVARMIDGGEKDDKLLAVYADDPRYKEWQSIKDIPQHFLHELKHFFETYKELENKECKILEFLDKDAAYKDVKTGQELYKKKFGKKK